jgi:TRAP-type uncharacterized transport system substrate-binding protein
MRRRSAPHLPASLTAFLISFVTAGLAADTAQARLHRTGPRPASSRHHDLQKQPVEAKHNETALMILGGHPGTPGSDIVNDMAAALAGNGRLRVIPVDAAGGLESLRDLLLLRGIDLALVTGNVLDDAERAGALGAGLRGRVAYVTALYSEEVHLLAGPGVSALENLAGRKVAVPPDDAGAEFTVRDLLRRLQVEAEVVRIAADDAIDDVRSGALGALALVGGKPLRFVASLPKDGSVHLLALPSSGLTTKAASGILGDSYSPGVLSADDYPALIPSGASIDTVSVSALLLARNAGQSEDSGKRVARFVPALFGALTDLAGPHWHPKWREVNLAATLPGWSRVPAAKEWLEAASREQSAAVRHDFDEFLRTNRAPGMPAPSPAEQRRLFEQYLEWTRRGIERPH